MNEKIYNILLEEYNRILKFYNSIGDKYYIECPDENNLKDIKIYTKFADELCKQSFDKEHHWDESDANYDLYIKNNKYENGHYPHSRENRIAEGYIPVSFTDFKRYIIRKNKVEILLNSYLYKIKKEDR